MNARNIDRMKWRALTCVTLALLALAGGCKSQSAGRVQSRTVVVQSTTQPRATNGEAADASSRNIRVILDDAVHNAPPGDATVHVLVGKACRVQFRRDALGLVSDAPTPPLSEGLPRRPVYLDGTLTEIGSDGALLQAESGVIWIPWSSVLLIELRP